MPKLIVLAVVKKNSGKYEVSFTNDEVILLSENTIAKFRIYKGKELELSMLNDIIIDNNYNEIYEIALKYVFKYFRTRLQVYDYLIKKDIPRSIANSVVDNLVKNKYINDFSFATNYVEKLINDFYGPVFIKAKLAEVGINSNDIDMVFSNIEDSIFLEKGLMKATKQLKNYTKFSSEQTKIKIQRYLFQRGYTYNQINIIIDKVLVTN